MPKQMLQGAVTWLLPIVFFALSSVSFGVTFSTQRVSTTNPQASSGCVTPPAVTSFLTTDAAVYLYFYSTTTLSDHITSDWLGPDGTALKGGDWSNPVTDNHCYRGESLGPLSNTPKSRLGLWQARVYANGALLFTVPFTISAPGTGFAGQVITTVAGGGWRAFPASDIPATSAPLGTPWSPALDAQGNVYVADSYNNIVVRISPSGTLRVVAGNGNAGFSGDGGPATSASLDFPSGVALDTAGNVFMPPDISRMRWLL